MTHSSKLLWALLLGFALSVATAAAVDPPEAQAKSKKKRKKKKAKKKAQPKAANTRAISELMGGFEWGMSPKQVTKILYGRIDEKYKEAISGTTDVYQQDKLRAKAKKEKKKLFKSYVKFAAGKRTGWDVSIIDSEFGLGDDEAMLVFWEQDPEKNVNQRRFFFFVDGQLYKQYIAFDATMFPEGKRKFVYFHEIMEARYGKGELVFLEDRYGSQQIKHVHWKDDKFYLRAVNRLEFYGTFCLSLSDSSVERWIYDRRAERAPAKTDDNQIIDNVVEDDNSSTTLTEANENAIDHILRGD